jgi:hypothetical protein
LIHQKMAIIQVEKPGFIAGTNQVILSHETIFLPDQEVGFRA